MQNWDLIRAFLALHRAGTFEGAAQLLGVDQSTLRRRVQSLEQEVGSQLFCRREGRYFLMPAMQPMLDAALRMDASSRTFFQDSPLGQRGSVRVTMLDFIACWLAEDLAQFRVQHPEIQLDVSTEHYFVDLENEMVDVAIRLARPTKGRSRLRKLGTLDYGIYASKPADMQLAGVQASNAQLLTTSTYFARKDHEFLMWESNWAIEKLPPGDVVFTTDSYLVIAALCEAGGGTALLPCVLGDSRSGLTCVSDEKLDANADIWLVAHSDTSQTGRVRCFLDYVADVFQRRLHHVAQ